MKELWYQKYRPKNLDEYVFVDKQNEDKIKEWVQMKEFPHLLLSGNPGTGKCLEKGTEVLMFDGSIRKVEDIQENDLVMGPDSNPRLVVGLANGISELYKITLSNGDSYTVNDAHIISLKSNNDNTIKNINVKEFYESSMTDDEYKYEWKHWKPDTIYFKMHDENFENAYVETIDYFANNMEDVSYLEKFKHASSYTRYEVLASIIDSIGEYKNKLLIKTVSEDLSKFITFLARSLGIKTHVNSRRDGYEIHLHTKLHVIPSRTHKFEKEEDIPNLYSFSIEKLDEGEYYGFELVGDDKLFLLGDFTVTHNTSLAKLLINECGYDDMDVKYISASIYNGIEVVRDEIIGFCERMSFGVTGRVVVIDEADYTSNAFQAGLRNIITDMSGSSRFILTCNYPHKIISALKSRCFQMNFSSLNKDQFILRLAEILTKENVKFDIETLDYYASKYHPDMRQAINALENNTTNNQLNSESKASNNEDPDWMKEVIVFFEMGQVRKAREILVKNLTYEEYENFYNMLYNNLEWFGDTEEKQDAALLAIKDAYVNDSSVVNREIVLSACLIKLNKIRQR